MGAKPNASWNVIVCGGGLTGVCAATAAARAGAKTLLIERDGSLGGTMTNNLVGPMMTFHSPERQVVSGLAQEIVDRLVAMGASSGHIADTSDYCATITPFDAEALKLVCQRMVLEAGGKILYNTFISGVLKEGNQVCGVRITNKAGQTELKADVVIDTTGDADVAYLAGAPYEMGREADGGVQPLTLMFKLTHVDNAALRAYASLHLDEVNLSPEQMAHYLNQELNKNAGFAQKLRGYLDAGKAITQRSDLLFFNTNLPDEVIVNSTRVGGVNPLDPWALSEAENTAREQVFGLLEFFRKEIPGFAACRLGAVGLRVGVRESRRIRGEYTLTAADILARQRFPDAIAQCAYPIDIHAVRAGEAEFNTFSYHGEVFDLPYRCLVPLGVEQLLVAGRCVSASHEAQAAIRTSPTCMTMGQAAGEAAVQSLREEVTPRQVDTDRLRQSLLEKGVLLG
jgi:hypothetical protein